MWTTVDCVSCCFLVVAIDTRLVVDRLVEVQLGTVILQVFAVAPVSVGVQEIAAIGALELMREALDEQVAALVRTT